MNTVLQFSTFILSTLGVAEGVVCPQIEDMAASVEDDVCVWRHIRYGKIDLNNKEYGWYSRSSINTALEQFKEEEKETSLIEYDNDQKPLKRVRCLQSEAGTVVGQPDCLALNVFVPQTTDDADLPVMVWIHGGMFTVGSSDDWVYRDAQKFAENEKIIIVSINYRLNYFGFLSYDENTLNNGLYDQRNAIEWVYQHISQFGGNPDRITVAGESAGATSAVLQAMRDQDLVLDVSARPRHIKGLIVQSDPSGIFLHTGADKMNDFHRSSKSAECGDDKNPNYERKKEMFACMRDQGGDIVNHGQKILTNSVAAQGGLLDGFYFLGPASETDFFRAQPMEFSGKLTIPSIYGTNREEGVYFATILEQALEGFNWLTSWPLLTSVVYGSSARLKHHYDQNENPLLARWTPTMTDYLFYCPLTKEMPLTQEGTTYVYQSQAQDYCSGPYAGPGPKYCEASVSPYCKGKACHGNEVPSLFGTWSCYPSSCCEPKESLKYEQLTKALQSHWGSFVRTGAPKEDWRPYTATDQVMIFGNTGSLGLGASDYNAITDLESVCKDFNRPYGARIKKDQVETAAKPEL